MGPWSYSRGPRFFYTGLFNRRSSTITYLASETGLNGKQMSRIMITGATRGLGRALVDSFVALGHEVIGCGRSENAVDALKSLGNQVDFSVVDVRDETSVASWANRVIATRGVPDLLISNAAIANRPESLWQISSQEFDEVIDTNIKGVANIIRHVVPAMIQAGRGVIVNLSSGWGRSTSPSMAPYCATKWAIEGLTRALVKELPQGLAAIPLNPGIIDTDMLRICFGDQAGGFPKPGEWARSAVPFLLGLGPKDNGKPLTVPGH
jgi:NAD(P)-dependent dehydrogenase (short-subunit alcohol dehydrogenase family)